MIDDLKQFIALVLKFVYSGIISAISFTLFKADYTNEDGLNLTHGAVKDKT